MAKKKIIEIIRYLEKCLHEEGLKFSQIILFGSQVRGNAHEESDIDIVIISKDFRNKDIFERALMTKEPEIKTIKKFMVPLDIITLTPEEMKTSLIADYAKEGKAIYAK
jgi:predicted nucleotidyltransferase